MNNALAAGGMAFTPQTIDEAMAFCNMLAKSSMVPKDYVNNPGNVFVAIQWGMELGLQPMQAMQNISVINGRPAVWGDAMLALVQGSGKLESISEEVTETHATCTIKRIGQPEIVRTFSREDAKQAGLLGKQGPWQQYPKRMMQNRARAWALRDGFADVLRGMAVAEEAQDLPVERDVTPQAATEKPATRAEQVKARLSKPATVQQLPPPSLDEVVFAISKASTPDDMAAVKDLAGRLTDETDKAEAREAFALQLQALKAKSESAATHEPQQDDFLASMAAEESQMN